MSERKRLGGWWRLWIVASCLWIIPILVFAFSTADYRSLDDYRLDRLTRSCTTYENGQEFLLNRVYTENQLKAAYRKGEHRGEAWWDDLGRCVKAYDIDYAAQKHEQMIGHFTPMIMVTFLLPLLTLVIGLSFGWIVRGFRKSPQ